MTIANASLASVGNYYRTRQNGPVIIGVMHITAGATDYVGADTSAEGTLNWFRDKASKVSIHGIVDSDTVADCLPSSATAWHAAGYNSRSVGLEIGTGQVDWRKAPEWWVAKTIKNAAEWWAPRVKETGLPLVKVTKAQVDAVYRNPKHTKPLGFIGHGDLDPGNRADPGLVRGVDTFPWARFFDALRAELGQKPPTVTPAKPAKWVPLDVDGILGKATITAWQQYYGGVADGKIDTPVSPLIQRVQADLNRVHGLNLSSGQLDLPTEQALAWHYKTTATRAGWVKALQSALNTWGVKR